MTDQSTHTHAVLATVADALIQACLYRTCATVGGGVFGVRADKNNLQSGSLLHEEDCYL